MFAFFYDLLLFFLALCVLPKFLYQRFKFGKYRSSLKQRFGIGFPLFDKSSKRLIWIHAVSMGETKAVAPLAKMIKEAHPNSILMISSITETGHNEAQKSMPFADYHVYLPFDFSWILRPIIKKLKPDFVILCETDFWYNFMSLSKENGAVIALVNGKLSEKSLKRFNSVPFFTKRLFSLIDHFCLQSERYKERLLNLGVPQEKIEVTGNIKLDGNCAHLSDQELKEWQDKLKISSKAKVIVAGSTHHPEEGILIDTVQSLWKKDPNLKLILVPRHPERFSAVAELLQSRKVPFVKYSEIGKASGRENVLLIDAMGMLRTCYQLASIAFVGGSLTSKVGGHNILEPSWYGKPVVFGPFMHTQLDLVDVIKEYDAGIQAPSEKLEETFLSLLESKETSQKIGKAGLTLVSAMQGATERTFKSLENYFRAFAS